MARYRTGAGWLVLALVLGGADLATAAGVEPDSADSTRSRRGSAWITELGYATAISRSNSAIDSKYGTFDLGYLTRTGERTLVGGDLSFVYHDDGVLWAVRPRVRRELDRNWGVDVAAGLVFAGAADDNSVDGIGVSAVTEFHYRGFVGATLGLQSVDYGPVDPYSYTTYEGRTTTTLAGVRVGRLPGALAAVALGIAAIIAVSTIEVF